MKQILFVILALLTAVSGFSQSNLQPAATVNLIRTEQITVGQLRTEVTRMEQATGRPLNKTERLQVLDVMINERLALQAAERDRVMITDNEVNQQIQQLRSMLAQQLGRNPTEAEFERAVREESGLDVAAFREQMRKQMVVQKYLMTKKETLINSIKPPTQEEVQSEFSLRRADFVRHETVEFVAIQIPFGSDAASRTNARTKGQALVRDIGNNLQTFDRKVDEASLPNSGYIANPGSLPRIPQVQEQYGQEFVNAAFSLKQGEVSRLIETPEFYVIMKVTRNLSHKSLELDDEMPPLLLMQAGIDPRTTVSVRVFLQNLLLARNQQAIIAQASQELVTELRSNRTFTVFDNNINW